MFSIYHIGRTTSPFALPYSDSESLIVYTEVKSGRTPIEFDALLLLALPLLLTLAKFDADETWPCDQRWPFAAGLVLLTLLSYFRQPFISLTSVSMSKAKRVYRFISGCRVSIAYCSSCNI